MKKITVALIMALILTFVFSCNEDNQTAQNDSGGKPDVQGSQENPEATESEQEIITNNVPLDLKFDGRTFTVLSREELIFGREMGVEEENGDIVNDAVYKRNKTVEERFGIKINDVKIPGIWGKEASFNDTIRNSVNAGDNIYDLIAGYAYFITPLAAEGYLLDWGNVHYIENTAPWWSSDIEKTMKLNGKLYFITGDLALTFIENLQCMFFNGRIQNEYAVEDLYKLVLDGKWTYDKLFDICKDIYSDVNGNAKKDEEDIYGLFSLYDGVNIEQMLISQNQPIAPIGDDGYPYLALKNEKTAKIVENIVNLLWENPGVYVVAGGTEYLHVKAFQSGKSLFMEGMIGYGEQWLRGMEDNFGVLPHPKFDEVQDKYMGQSEMAFSLFCIPSIADDYEFIGAVTDVLAAESYKQLTPVYYETSLKIKYARDDMTSQMIDIIRNGVKFDFGLLNSSSMQSGGILALFRELATNKNKNFISIYEKREAGFEKSLQQLIDAYKEIN